MRRDDPDAVELHDPAAPPWPTSWTDAGVIGQLEPMVNVERRTRILQVFSARIESVTLLLDGPYDPHNSAAVMRSCDAFAVQHLHIASNEPLLMSQKVAQGTQRWISVTRYDTSAQAVAALKALNFTLVTAHPQGTLVPADLTTLPRVAIVLGNEHRGVSAEAHAAAAHTVRIPMRGFVESLNLSVSAAILLNAATLGRAGDLSQEQQRHCYARGLYQSVISARAILDASTPR